MSKNGRDEFSQKIRDEIAKRAGFQCSRPGCPRFTSGPQDDPAKSVNVGVAAHMAAASLLGPRYDPIMTPEQRMAAENGIWLCQTCGKLVDNDISRFPVDKLRAWKLRAEARARRRVEGGHDEDGPGPILVQVENRSFWFMGQDAAASLVRSKRENAMFVQCWVPTKFYNPRPRNVGLMDIRFVFLKAGMELLEVVPGEHTGRVVHGKTHWPDTATLTLPADSWFSITFARCLAREQMATVADCDEILLTASTVDGEAVYLKIGSGFVESEK